MKCIICNSLSASYFTTDFNIHFGGKLKNQLEKSEYYKCNSCGFTFSKDVYEMSQESWLELNVKAHSQGEAAPLKDRLTNQPPYLAQASMINMLIRDGIIYGGGGQMSITPILIRKNAH